jgi:hypothetical protein
LTLTGFSIGEVDRICGNYLAGRYDDLEDDDPPPLGAGAAQARLGDLYHLGPHRLLCGDAGDESALARLMDCELAQACFTDPPYNVAINGHVSGSGRHREFAMASGEMSRPQFTDFLTNTLSTMGM